MTWLQSLPAHRRDLLFLLLAAAVILAAGLGLRQPWPADEPRFVLLARTMLDSGDYWFPRRGSELYADKPPLFMWLQVLAYRLVGHWNIAFLLPSLLAALGTLWLTHDLTRRLWGRRAARIAGWLLLFTVQFTYQAKRAQIDPLLVFLVTLSCYGLLRHLLLGPHWRWYWAGCLAAGFGVIVKGVGVIALLMLLPFWLARRWPATRLAPIEPARGRWLLGALAVLLPLLIWPAPMLWQVWQHGDPGQIAYAREILFGQTATRFVHPGGHLQPPWYFLEVIAIAWLPLSLLLPWALPLAWRRLLRRRDARVLLPLGWAALVVLFFSLSPGKRDMYILPALPMLLVGLAPSLVWTLRLRAGRRVLLAANVVLAAGLLIAGLWAVLGTPGFESGFERSRGLAADSDRLWWLCASLGLAGLLVAAWFGQRRAFAGLGLTLAMTWTFGFGWIGFPMLDAANSSRALMLRAGSIIGPEAELGLVAWREQNLLQADRTVSEFGFSRPAAEQLARGIDWLALAPDRRWLLADAEALAACVDRAGWIEVGQANRRRWVLIRYAVAASCQR
ncbi:MAG: ArnT family glycosyltransferase [Lysobacterales bacterium]